MTTKHRDHANDVQLDHADFGGNCRSKYNHIIHLMKCNGVLEAVTDERLHVEPGSHGRIVSVCARNFQEETVVSDSLSLTHVSAQL